MTGLIVTFAHLRTIPHFTRQPGFCRAGAQAFFRAHGLDWRSFVRNGIPADDLAATGDAMAMALVDWAQRCEQAATTAQQESDDGR